MNGFTDLPPIGWRFLISGDDDKIEAWDHADNPNSGRDDLALIEAAKALLGDPADWRHDRSRADVADAVILTVASMEVAS